MSKKFVGVKIEEADWKKVRRITGKGTDTEIVRELIQMAINSELEDISDSREKATPKVPDVIWQSAHRITGKTKFTPWTNDKRTVEITEKLIEIARANKIEESRKKYYPKKKPEKYEIINEEIFDHALGFAKRRIELGQDVTPDILRRHLKANWGIDIFGHEDEVIKRVMDSVHQS